MRILIATVTAGAGHLQAAAAMEEAWRVVRPHDDLKRVDVLDFASKLYRKAYATGYMKVAEQMPELYEMFFKKTDNPALLRKLTKFRRTAARAGGDGFLKFVKKFAPDVAVCVHFLPSELLGNLRADAKAPVQPKVVTIVTDFEAHALWMEPGVDLYCVATEATKARLVARGLAAENVVVTGIPISERFSARINPAEVRKRLGLRDDLPVLLVLGGGFGMGPVSEILGALNQYAAPVQVMVVCGRNEELRRKIAVLNHRHPTHILGFATNMQELMAISSIILTKPGGLTTSEALALGKPLFIINPIPGQEAANSDFLLEHGAATKVNRVEDIPFKLGEIFGGKKLAALAKAAKALGCPNAARDICTEVARRFGGV
jgi:processive 1,2-diacylglycerol beta-glucosyltransferase